MYFTAVAMLALAACGGGGDASPAPGAGGGSGSAWQAGVFLDAGTFFARCDVPRSGTDPFTNLAYQDIQGSVLDENNFLRSISDATYLWYDEITDQDPGLFSNTLVYFDELKTNATTASGRPKDKFHFTFESEEWLQLSQSDVLAGYGAQWVILSSTVPREIVVAYIEPNSPATSALVNLARGARILTIDGVDVVNGSSQQDIDTLNAGLFPSSVGETHTFGVQDVGSLTTRTVSMTSDNIAPDPVQTIKVIDTPTGQVGYFQFNDHIATAEDQLINAVNTLNNGQGIVDLVLDIRYNSGGILAIASQMAYMIAGPAQVAGRSFETQQFNDQHPITNPATGNPITPVPFYDETLGFGSRPTGQALPTLNLGRVYVLTGPGTCSTSESIINGLNGIDVEVIQIGSTTCGKPYGFYEIPNCGTSYFTIQFRGVNANDFGDYTDGFSPLNTSVNAGTLLPGCSVADDFTHELGDVDEARLAAALDFRATLTCPAATGMRTLGQQKAGQPLSATDGIVPKSPWHTNRIMHR